MMNILMKIFFFFRGFTGIIIYWTLVLVAGFDTDTAVLAALSYVIFYSLVAIGANRVVRVDFGVLIFFSVGYVCCIFFPEKSVIYLIERFTTFLYLSLFLTVFLPFVFGAEPFTVINAKRITPEAVWDTKEFKEITNIMSLVWCALFFTAFLISLKRGVVTQIFVPVGIMLFIGFPFNRYFRDLYLKFRGIS